MFTGIVEGMGEVIALEPCAENLRIFLRWEKAPELHVDQSLSHNGICLTVEEVLDDQYRVTAVQETVQRTNIKQCKKGDLVNLERSMLPDSRLDGHLVQGHVDEVVRVSEITEASGSWYFTFNYSEKNARLLVEKGSVCLNGVSLTVVEYDTRFFKTAIIPYTFEHTNFAALKQGDEVNVEYDILGKYIARNFEVINV